MEQKMIGPEACGREEQWSKRTQMVSLNNALLILSSRIKVRSPTQIYLRSTYGALQSVNKELLCYFSPYYAAASHGQFAESRQEIFDVDLTGKQLHVFINWVHTGKLDLHDWDREDRIQLYIFADFTDILALRRQIVTHRDIMEKYREIGVVLSSLSSTSPLRMRIADHYANHWVPADDIHDSRDTLDIGSQLEWNNDLAQSKDRAKNKGHAGCSCCGNPCRYHEHINEEEWRATCGQLPTSRKPENRYYINSGIRVEENRLKSTPRA